MAVEAEKQPIEEIQKLEKYLPEKSVEELEQILAYGEEIKAEGAKKKKDFWSKYKKDDFVKILSYKKEHQKEMEGKYKYLDMMNEIERERFIEEYLYDDLLYSCEIPDEFGISLGSCSYKDWKNGKVKIDDGTRFLGDKNMGLDGLSFIAKNMRLKYGMSLFLNTNQIGDKGAEVISKMEVKDGIYLGLQDNNIGDEGAIAVANNLKLKNGVNLDLSRNQIGDKGAKVISKMKLKEGVTLDLHHNQIGDGGAIALSKVELEEGVVLDISRNDIGDVGVQAIMDNMELKQNVTLILKNDRISDEMKENVEIWKKGYKDRGINCKVII